MMLQQILELELAGALEFDNGAAMRAVDLERGLGARGEARIVLAVTQHPNELVDVRQIVRQRRAGKDVRQVELVTLQQAEVLDIGGAGADQNIECGAGGGCGPARSASSPRAAIEEPRGKGLVLRPGEVAGVDCRGQPVGRAAVRGRTMVASERPGGARGPGRT